MRAGEEGERQGVSWGELVMPGGMEEVERALLEEVARASWDDRGGEAPESDAGREALAQATRNQRLHDEIAQLGVSIPRRFLDAITLYLMTDPVTLPTSSRVVDRSTITRHVLRHGSDPFSRTPLHLADIATDEQLKRQILDFLASPPLRSLAGSNTSALPAAADAEPSA